jgi:5-methylcytosine-specific restriction endonuclease McrA
MLIIVLAGPALCRCRPLSSNVRPHNPPTMQFHAFNIGKPHIDAWWSRNQKLGIITAGYAGKRGDRGDVILNQLAEGDWILAFSSGHGFVGAGKVGPQSTYRLLRERELPAGWEATHRHIRQVSWLHAVASLVQAVPSSDVDRKSPRQTKERIPKDVAERLIKLLAQRAQFVFARDTLSEFTKTFAEKVKNSSQDTPTARLQRLQRAQRLPSRVPVLTYEFVRNPDVVAEVLYRASHCGRCKLPAPFVRSSDSTPYLEVHHRTPLSQGGEDTVKNAVALCPNCHRELHYGRGAA